MQDAPWYHHWFGADYLQLYQHRSSREAAHTVAWLIGELHLPPPARVLDLACGNGRHSRELVRRGFHTVGFDLSWPLLVEAQTGEPTSPLQRIRGDMRHLPLKSAGFALVLSLFTSFGYFNSPEDDREVLREVARVLQAGGTYVLDFLNAPLIQSQIVPTEETALGGQKATIMRWLDEPNQRIEKRILIHESDGAIREYRESVRLYSEEELRLALREVGIAVRSTFGNYDGSPLYAHSPRLILIACKDG